VRCAYCGKGIGPLRQLKDRKFCTDTHRFEYHEQFRRKMYEALAPEAPPTGMADFRLQPAYVETAHTSFPRICLNQHAVPAAFYPLMHVGAAARGATVGWLFDTSPLPLVAPRRSADALMLWRRQALICPFHAANNQERAHGTPAGWLFDTSPLPLVTPRLLADGLAIWRNQVLTTPFHAAINLKRAHGVLAGWLFDTSALPLVTPRLADALRTWRNQVLTTPFPAALDLKRAHGAPAGWLPEASPLPQAAPRLWSDLLIPWQNQTLTTPFRAAVDLDRTSGVPAGWLLDASHPANRAPRLSAGTSAPAHIQPRITTFQVQIAASAKTTASAIPTLLEPAHPAPARLSPAAVLRVAHALCAPVALPEIWKPVLSAGISAEAPSLARPVPSRFATAGPLAFPDRAASVSALAAACGQPELAMAGTLVHVPSSVAALAYPVALEALGPRGYETNLPVPRAVASARGMGFAEPMALPNAEPSPETVAPTAARFDIQRNRRPVVLLPDIGSTLPAEQPETRTPQTAPLVSLAASCAAEPPAALPCWNARPAVLGMNLGEPKSLANQLLRAELPSPPPALDTPAALAEPVPDSGRTTLARGGWQRHTEVLPLSFSLHPVRVRFPDLLRGGSTVYAEEQADARSNVRQMRPRGAQARPVPGWQRMAALAAGLLLAGMLWPRAALNGVGKLITWKSGSVRDAISTRATRSFADNFRAGFEAWKSADLKSLTGWSYNRDGYVQPGRLALYQPSMKLDNYRMEFLAQVENKSVDWVVRARDTNNYYALKFTVVQPGPRPLVAMVRYPVIQGRHGTRVQIPVRTMIHADMPYHVTVDVKGNQYRAYIEGQQADYWTDDRLKKGGVGFFSEAGEHARVYWVKLESNDDFWGKVCAYLAAKTGRTATNMENQAMDYRHSAVKDKDSAPGPGGAEIISDAAQDGRLSRVLSRAASLHLENKRDEAVQVLRRAIDEGERHPALYFALGQLQYELEDYETAAQSYAQAAMLQPLHPTAHFNTGVCLGRLERWEEAAEFFHVAIANDPARMEAHLALGACLVHTGRHNEALEAYDRFLARYPDHEEAMFGKAVALQKRDRLTEAAELYRRVAARNPRSEEALTNLVSLYLDNHDYEQVRQYAERLAELQPRSQVAWEGLAAAAFAAGDHAAATVHSRKLAELGPQVFENWFNLGVACHKSGDLKGAQEAYTRAAKVQPTSAQAHLNLGVSQHETGDLNAARASYQRALEIDPNLPGVHWNLGLVHEQLGDTAAAETFYAKVPTNTPDYDDAAFRIGHLRLQRGDFAGSIETFQACLQKRPDWPEARLNLGIAHWRSGDKDAARACFQELSASGTDSKEALRGLAALALERQEYDKAFDVYRQLIDTGERSPELLYNAALICQKRGQPEDAAMLYREALKVDPQFGEALLNLGHALMSLGDEFEARSCWRKAVMAKPELAQHYFEPVAAAV